MADQENVCGTLRVTRTSNKRPASAMAEEPRDGRKSGNKRAALSELKNTGNICVSVNPNLGKENQKPKVGKERTGKGKKVLNPPVGENCSAVLDIDSKADDSQMCAAYAKDIFEYLHLMEVEPRRRPVLDYLQKVQKDLTAHMRGVLVDWLVEVAEEYCLVSETLYLTVSYVDRFLSQKSLNRQQLQLLGVSAMLIASRKYEEIRPPSVEDFCYITDNAYAKEEVLKMESDILSSLKFELGNPTTLTFLRRFTRISLKCCNAVRSQVEYMSHYLSELSLLDYGCIKFLPSLVAASAIFLARFLIQPKMHPWTQTLQEYTKYKPGDIKECVLILHDLYLGRREGGLHAVRDKYNQAKFQSVANIPSHPEIPISLFEDIS